MAVSLLPSLRLGVFAQEWIHQALLLLVVPVVAYAVKRGYEHHSLLLVPLLATLGVVFLLVGGLWGHDLHLETPLTVAGSLFLVAAHLVNFRSLRVTCDNRHCAA